uniref:Uncharacterized protein n=1 Tax=Anguilla anguilla TaxID=7936 RepID=A0A0E9XYW1_ANGAN
MSKTRYKQEVSKTTGKKGGNHRNHPNSEITQIQESEAAQGTQTQRRHWANK